MMGASAEAVRAAVAGLLREWRIGAPADAQEDAELRQRILREVRPINLGMQLYGAFGIGLTHWLAREDFPDPWVLAPVYAALVLSLALSLLWRGWLGLSIGRFVCLMAVVYGLRITIQHTDNAFFWPIPVALVLSLGSAIAYDHMGEYAASNLLCWGILCDWDLVPNGHPDQATRIALLMLSGIALGIAINLLFTVSRRSAHRLNLQMARMANRDFLTGIRNRRSFLEGVEADMRSRPLADRYCLMLDVDNFKKINDDFGHATGDRVLVEIADALSRVSGGQLCGRLGGEEFGILVTGLQFDEVQAFAARAVQEIGRMQINERPLSVSIGVARCPLGVALAHTMQRADHALYQAKHAGKNRYVVEPPPLGLVV